MCVKLYFWALYFISLVYMSIFMPFLVAQTVKNLSAMWETWVQSLGWEDPLEKGMPTNSSILAWRISWTEEPGGLQSWGCKESDKTKRLTHKHMFKRSHCLKNKI